MADQLSGDDIDRLAAKLDQIDGQLTREESALLSAVFRLAGDALAEHLDGDEVSGFSAQFPGVELGGGVSGASLSEGFRDSFHPASQRYGGGHPVSIGDGVCIGPIKIGR